MAKPTSTPPAGWQWVVDPEWEPGDGERDWILARAPAPPAPVGPYPGWTPGMPDAPPKPGFHWESAGMRDGVSQGLAQVPNGQTFAQTQEPGYDWQKRMPGEVRVPSRFTPIAKLPVTPQAEPPYAGNVPLPIKDAWKKAVGRVSKWNWKPQGTRSI